MMLGIGVGMALIRAALLADQWATLFLTMLLGIVAIACTLGAVVAMLSGTTAVEGAVGEDSAGDRRSGNDRGAVERRFVPFEVAAQFGSLPTCSSVQFPAPFSLLPFPPHLWNRRFQFEQTRASKTLPAIA